MERRSTRERAVALRATGMSLRQIADELNVSKARVGQILHPYNPEGKPITYRCERCGHRFTSSAKSKPGRCPADGGCGSSYWSRPAPAAAAA